MSWFVETGCVLDAADLPVLLDAQSVPKWVGVAGPMIDARDALMLEETEGFSGWVIKRQKEFSSGRLYARRAMARLGVAVQAVRREENRAPVWPPGVIGSVTHCDDVAAVLMCKRGGVRAVGVDIECRGRIQAELYRGLFTPAEQEMVRSGLSATLLFTAKEAIYKALHPEAGVFIDFPEMELAMRKGRLAASYRGDHKVVHVLMPDLCIEACLLREHAAAVTWLA